jgi:ComF family protein
MHFPRLSKAVDGILDFIYPPQCLICAAAEHATLTPHLCEGCVHALFAEPSVPPFDLRDSLDRHGTSPPVDACHAAWPFSETMQKIVHAMKYGSKPSLGRLLAKGMSRRIDGRMFCRSPESVIAPVPMHTRRQRERGYNQSAVLARELARCWNLPLNLKALRRRRDTVQQALLPTAAERHINVQDAFHVKPLEVFAHKTVLLVDDVVTTGSTANSCAEALKSAGATRVYVLAAARA